MSTMTHSNYKLDRVDLHGAEGDEFVTFARPVDIKMFRRVLKLDAHDWIAMGEPDVVMVYVARTAAQAG